MIAPDSIDNMRKILDVLKVKYFVGIHRSSLIISCDGNPFMFIQNIINDDLEKKYSWVHVVPGITYIYFRQIPCLLQYVENIGRFLLRF